MNKRFGISIDIEGFSSLYEYSEDTQSKAIWGLHQLMDAILRLGTVVYLNDVERIFAHQFGDGFVLVSNFEEPDPRRCIAIATSLTRHMLLEGFTTKAAISAGSMVDITGCYPEAMRDSKNNTVSMGAGLLTTVPVMGTALTKSHKLGGRVSGNVIVIDVNQFSSIPEELIKFREENVVHINWMSDENNLAREISEKAGLQFGNEKQLISQFEAYIATEPRPPKKWIEGSRIGLCKASN